eukprot:gene2469-517_t
MLQAGVHPEDIIHAFSIRAMLFASIGRCPSEVLAEIAACDGIHPCSQILSVILEHLAVTGNTATFERVWREMAATPDAHLYNAKLKLFARLRDLPRALAILQEMREVSVQPTQHSFVIVLNAAARMQDQALFGNVWALMLESGLDPNQQCHAACLRLVAEQGDASGLISLLSKMPHGGSEVPAKFYASLLGVMAEHSVEAFDRVWNAMAEAGYEQGVGSWIHRIDCWAKFSGLPVAAAGFQGAAEFAHPKQHLLATNYLLERLAVAKDMDTFVSVWTSLQVKGLAPNAYSYTSLVRLHCSIHSPLAATTEALKSMIQNIPRQNLVVHPFNMVLEYCISTNQGDAAQHLWTLMPPSDLRYDLVSAQMLPPLVCVSDSWPLQEELILIPCNSWAERWNLWESYQTGTFGLPFLTVVQKLSVQRAYTIKLKHMGSHGLYPSMVALLSQMRACRVRPDPWFFEELLSRLSGSPTPELTLTVMVSVPVTSKMLKCYAYALCIAADDHTEPLVIESMVASIWALMEVNSVDPNTFQWNMRIKATALARPLQQALTVLDAMIDSSVTPDIYTYQTLLKIWEQESNHQHGIAEQLLSDITRHGLVPTAGIHGCAVRMAIREGNPVRFMSAWASMQAEGCSPDAAMVNAWLVMAFGKPGMAALVIVQVLGRGYGLKKGAPTHVSIFLIVGLAVLHGGPKVLLDFSQSYAHVLPSVASSVATNFCGLSVPSAVYARRARLALAGAYLEGGLLLAPSSTDVPSQSLDGDNGSWDATYTLTNAHLPYFFHRALK